MISPCKIDLEYNQHFICLEVQYYFMKFKVVNDLAIFLDNIISEKHLSKLQEFLLSGAIFTEASKVLAIIVIFILASEIALAITLAILNLPAPVLILPLFIFPGLFTYVVVV